MMIDNKIVEKLVPLVRIRGVFVRGTVRVG